MSSYEQLKSQELQIQTPHLELAARRYGQPGAPAVLCLHGWLDNLESFTPLIEEIDRSGFDINRMDLVSLDFPGHGHSAHRPQGIQQYFVDHVPMIRSVIEALGWSQLCMIGHSMGAGVSALYSGTFPEMVTQLVLLDGLGPLSDPPEKAPQRLRQAIDEDMALKEKTHPVYKSLQQATHVRARSSKISEQSARLFVERGMLACEGGYTWRHDPRLKTASAARMTEEQICCFLENIEAPVLAIMAQDSRFQEFAKRIGGRVDHIKNLELVQVSGGHHVHMDHPEIVARHVLPILSKIADSQASNL